MIPTGPNATPVLITVGMLRLKLPCLITEPERSHFHPHTNLIYVFAEFLESEIIAIGVTSVLLLPPDLAALTLCRNMSPLLKVSAAFCWCVVLEHSCSMASLTLRWPAHALRFIGQACSCHFLSGILNECYIPGSPHNKSAD